MSKRKVIYLVLVSVIVILLASFYNAFNGNPLSKMYAKKQLQDYLAAEYPEEEFNLKDGFYNFKFSEYNFEVIKIGDASSYEFSVRGGIFPSTIQDGIYYANLDETLMERMSKEASKEIMQVLEAEVDSVLSAWPQIEILQGRYNDSVKWTKDLEIEKPLHIHIHLDATNLSAEDILADTITIQNLLNENNYYYESVTINGNDMLEVGKDELGEVLYVSRFSKDTKLTIKDIEESN